MCSKTIMRQYSLRKDSTKRADRVVITTLSANEMQSQYQLENLSIDMMGSTFQVYFEYFVNGFTCLILPSPNHQALLFLTWRENIHPWQMMSGGWCSTGSIGDEVKTRLSPAFANLGQRSPTQPWETLAIMLPPLTWHTKPYTQATLLIASNHMRVEMEPEEGTGSCL